MSRLVLRGTPIQLHRLLASDLPADNDLTYSHFRYVNADGFDLTGYGCDWMDWIHCSAKGVAIPTGSQHLYSYKTDWTDAPLPIDFNALNRDFLIEALHQQAAKSRGKDAKILLAGASHVDQDIGASWKTIVPALGRQGYVAADVMRVGIAAFKDYPKATHRWSEEFKTQRWRDSAFAISSPSLNIVSPDGGRIRMPNILWSNDLKAAWLIRDRWLVGSLIIRDLNIQLPRGAPWSATVINFDPVPVISIEPTFVSATFKETS